MQGIILSPRCATELSIMRFFSLYTADGTVFNPLATNTRLTKYTELFWEAKDA